MIEEEIDEEIIVADGEPILASHEGEANAPFKEKLAEEIEQTKRQIAFMGIVT